MNNIGRSLFRTAQVVLKRKPFFQKLQLFANNRQAFFLLSKTSSTNNQDTNFSKLPDEKPLLEGEFNEQTATEYLNNLTEEEEKTLNVLKLEYQVWGSDVRGHKMPLEMLDKWWARLLKTGKTRSRRMKLYRYWRKLENLALAKKEKLAKNKEIKELFELEKKGRESQVRNTIFLRLWNSTETKFYNSRAAQAMLFGRPMIVDMGYESYMSIRDMKTMIQQLLAGYSHNRKINEPSDLIFTNCDLNGYALKKIEYLVRDSDFKTVMVKSTDKSYLDLYPKERLVYMSPHASEELLEDHPDNIYIIGGYVDGGDGKEGQKPLSLSIAKKQNIRCVKLPLDRYLVWGQGDKVLTIDQTMSIVCDFMETKDWNKAFKWVPKRKLTREEDQREVRLKRYQNKYRDSKSSWHNTGDSFF